MALEIGFFHAEQGPMGYGGERNQREKKRTSLSESPGTARTRGLGKKSQGKGGADGGLKAHPWSHGTPE